MRTYGATWMMLLGFGCSVMSAAPTDRSCPLVAKDTEYSTPSTDGVREIISFLNITESDKVLVVDAAGSVAHQLFRLSPAREMIVLSCNQKTCDRLQEAFDRENQARGVSTREVGFEEGASTTDEQLTPYEKQISVRCGTISEVNLDAVNIIIAIGPEVAPADMVQRAIALPDGVKLLLRKQPEEEYASLRLVSIQSVAISATSTMTMYEYQIQRPTIEERLEEVYRGVSGFCIPQEDAKIIRQAGGDSAPTYGEILFDSAESLFNDLVKITKDDVVYDLGAGVGKLVLWLYLKTPARKVVGVELSDCRWALSQKALKRVKAEVFPEIQTDLKRQWGPAVIKDKKVVLEKGDITKVNLSDATVIYMCATSFPKELMQRLTDKMATLASGVRIISLNKLADSSEIRLVATHYLRMSWSKPDEVEAVYVYEVHHPLLRDVLETAYQDIPKSSSLSDEETASIKAQGGAPTYGETTFESAQTLFTDIFHATEKDVFYDLGSGLGRLVAHAYLLTPVRRAVGVECSETRCKIAQDAAMRMKGLLKTEPYQKLWKEAWGPAADTKEILFLKKNFMEVDFSDATMVYACATCYSEECMKKISEVCDKLPVGARVVTLKKLSDECPRLSLAKTHRLPMTWSSGVDLYEYHVKGQEGSSEAQGVSSQVKKIPTAGAKKQEKNTVLPQ